MKRHDTTRCRALCLAVVVLAMLSLFGVSGCALYRPVGKAYSHWSSGLQIKLPEKWLQYTQAKSGFVITRDGLRLERITINAIRVGKKLEGTERVYRSGMIPYEAAELTIGRIRNQEQVRNFAVEKIDTASLAGRDAFQVDAAYADEGGLRKRMRVYGAVIGNYFCEIVFEAADLVYFSKYENACQSVVSSAKLTR
jgi:hypothetical protein